MQPAKHAAVSTRYFQNKLHIEKISACRLPLGLLPEGWQLSKLLADLLLQGELSQQSQDSDPLVISDLPAEQEPVAMRVMSRRSYPRFLPFQYELFVDCLFRTQARQLMTYAGVQEPSKSSSWVYRDRNAAELNISERNERLRVLQQADHARSQARYQPLIVEDEAGRVRFLDVFLRSERQWRKKVAQFGRGRDTEWQHEVEAGFACGLQKIDSQHPSGVPCAFERLVFNMPSGEFSPQNLGQAMVSSLTQFQLHKNLQIQVLTPYLALGLNLVRSLEQHYPAMVSLNDYAYVLGWQIAAELVDQFALANTQQTKILLVIERFPLVDLFVVNGTPAWKT